MNNLHITDAFYKLPQNKRNRIFTAAIDEFSEKGYSGANINRIADNAQISIGSLYKYFNNKENLYLAIADLCVYKISNALSSIIREEDTFFQTVEKIISSIQDISKKESKLTKLYSRMCTESMVSICEKVSVDIEGVTSDLYASLIEKAQEKGELPMNINASYYAFFLDNLFMMLQFSYSCDYFKDRLKMFLSESAFHEDEKLKLEMMSFIRSAFKCV